MEQVAGGSERLPAGTEPGGDVGVPVDRTLLWVLTFTGRLGPFGVEDVGLLTVGVDIQDHELLVGFGVLGRVVSTLGVEDGSIEVTQPGAEVSAVLMGQVVGEGLGCLQAAEAL